MIKYEYFNNESLLIIEYSEIITKDEVLTFFNFSNNDKIQKVLADLTKATMDYAVDESDEISHVLSAAINKPIKLAMLVDSPKETALAIWFVNYLPSSLLDTIVCSTYQSGISHLSMNISLKEVKHRVSNLKCTFH